MKWLLKGFPGHPLHPPLTDATIGAYTFATAMAVLSRLGVSEDNTATAWWLALIAGLVVDGADCDHRVRRLARHLPRERLSGGRRRASDRDAVRDGICSRSQPDQGTPTTWTGWSAAARSS